MQSPTLDKYCRLTETQRQDLYKQLEKLTDAEIWQRPPNGKWSIGENLLHLYLGIRTMRKWLGWLLPVLTYWYRLFGFRGEYPTEIPDLYERITQKNKKLVSPKPASPILKDGKTIPLHILQKDMNKELQLLRNLLKSISEEVAGRTILYHPVARKRPNLLQFIHLIALHERHHFRAIYRILNPPVLQ